MTISLVIPSFQQGVFLRETLDSIVPQLEAGDEVWVIDGGSTDGTRDVLQSFGSRIQWLSEPDQGQTDAINKGLARISGDVWGYVNTDDPLLPGCLQEVRAAFADPDVMWAGGIGEVFDESGVTGEIEARPVRRMIDWLTPWDRPDPFVVPFSGCNFMRRAILDEIGAFDASYHYSMDIEHGVRAAFVGGYEPHMIPKRMARWRWHGESKTMKRGIAYAFREDEIRIAATYARYLPGDERAELEQELKREKMLLPPRKACAQLEEGSRSDALKTLFSGAVSSPASLMNRAWLGALKRVILRRSSARTA